MGSWETIIALLLLLSFLTNLDAADTLLPEQSLKDGQTLVSANKTFELGFFSPGNSSYRYVGIWYYDITPQTVVWVANREKLITDRSSLLTLDSGGNLFIIVHSKGNSVSLASSSARTVATLLDTGNLVLHDASNRNEVSWQSFDHPTDTFLPGMKLGYGGRRNTLLTSWTSVEDPSAGYYSFGANPNGTKQFFIWQKDDNYWDTGLWNGSIFSNVPEMTRSYIFNYGYTFLGDGEYFTYSLKDPSIKTRFQLDNSGVIKQWMYITVGQWNLFWAQPHYQCDVYNVCGDYGVCNDLTQPLCGCLRGFQPASPISTYLGCTRRTDLQCEAGDRQDGFIPLFDIKIPQGLQVPNIRSQKECESACLRNCTCTAYRYDGNCQWYGDLVNLTQLNDDTEGKVAAVYLRLAASEIGGNKKKEKLAIILSVLGTVVLIACLSFLWWVRRRAKRKQMQEQELPLTLNNDFVKKFGEYEKGRQEFMIFSFRDIAGATNNFSADNKLGEGGFGPVYKGELRDGKEIAVKRLSARSGQGLEEFKNEIFLISKLQHRNLVRLLGCCIQEEEKILIYEYMPNKSLDFYLFGPPLGRQLDWKMRLYIMEGIAQGLLYLHKHSRLRIIHRDLKASNILLDEDMNPKISDFGMARIFSSEEIQTNTNRVVGTYGYMAPEYASQGLFSIKSDVFSYGVLMLEILSGMRNTGFHQHGSSLTLQAYAWELWKEGKPLKLMDTLIAEDIVKCCSMREVIKCIHISLLCVQESADDRPTMSDVIAMLGGDGSNLLDPKQPAFFIPRPASEAEFVSEDPEICSMNGLTVTIGNGR